MPRHRVGRGAGGTSCRVWPRALAETWTAAGVREAKADPCSLRARLARRCSIVGCGAPDRIRTCDLRLRRPTLYPLSYRRAIGRRCGAARRDCTPSGRQKTRKRRSGSRRSRFECCPGEGSTGYPIVFCHVTRASITPAAPTTLTLPTHDPVTRAAASLARRPLLYPVATLTPRVFVRPRINISQHSRRLAGEGCGERSGRRRDRFAARERVAVDQASSTVTDVMATGESG